MFLRPFIRVGLAEKLINLMSLKLCCGRNGRLPIKRDQIFAPNARRAFLDHHLDRHVFHAHSRIVSPQSRTVTPLIEGSFSIGGRALLLKSGFHGTVSIEYCFLVEGCLWIKGCFWIEDSIWIEGCFWVENCFQNEDCSHLIKLYFSPTGRGCTIRNCFSLTGNCISSLKDRIFVLVISWAIRGCFSSIRYCRTPSVA